MSAVSSRDLTAVLTSGTQRLSGGRQIDTLDRSFSWIPMAAARVVQGIGAGRCACVVVAVLLLVAPALAGTPAADESDAAGSGFWLLPPGERLAAEDTRRSARPRTRRSRRLLRSANPTGCSRQLVTAGAVTGAAIPPSAGSDSRSAATSSRCSTISTSAGTRGGGYGLHVVFDNVRPPYTAVGFRFDMNHGRWHGPNAGR